VALNTKPNQQTLENLIIKSVRCQDKNLTQEYMYHLFIYNINFVCSFFFKQFDLARHTKAYCSVRDRPQGPTVIFSHHQVCVKRRRDDTFLAAQSESRISTPFFASKTI
jgi:hypothetical protein